VSAEAFFERLSTMPVQIHLWVLGLDPSIGRFRQPSIALWIFVFIIKSNTVAGDTRIPHRASVMSSRRRTETPARYVPIRASLTELSTRR
jgi:hypothetical protein